MVQVVVIDFGFFRAMSVNQRQGLEAVGLVQVGAVVIPGFFGNESVALPKKLRSSQAVGFGDTPAKGIVFVVPGAAIRRCDAREPVFAVVGIAGDQFLAFAAPLLDQVAEFVVFIMAITVHGEPVAAHIGGLTA